MSDESGPAFPAPSFAVPHGISEKDVWILRTHAGLSVRDYFAALAMQGYCTSDAFREDCDTEQTAQVAYMMADAMLKVRDK